MPKTENVTGTLIAKHHDALMGAWLAAQKRDGRSRDVGTDAASADLARQFLDQLHRGFSSGRLDDITGAEWAPMRELLEDFSRARATQGFSPTETAVFVFSLKEPLFDTVDTLADSLAIITDLVGTGLTVNRERI
jgi:rsbT co-antagonist protein RsbR